MAIVDGSGYEWGHDFAAEDCFGLSGNASSRFAPTFVCHWRRDQIRHDLWKRYGSRGRWLHSSCMEHLTDRVEGHLGLDGQLFSSQPRFNRKRSIKKGSRNTCCDLFGLSGDFIDIFPALIPG